MAPYPLPAPGTASGPPAPPLDPRTMDSLLRHLPGRAAAVLTTMPPAHRHAQLVAHATLADAVVTQIRAEWTELLRLARPTPDDDPLPASVIEPETLALMVPDDARAAVAALSPTQRVQQAVAQAAWLATFGYDVDHAELLAAWEADTTRTAP